MASRHISAEVRAEAEQLLRRETALADLPPEMQEKLLAIGEWRRIAAHQPLFTAGDHRSPLHGIAAGVVAFESSLASPAVPIIEVQPAPLWIAGQPQLDGGIRLNSAIARTDLLVFSVPAPELGRLLAAEPFVYRFMLRVVAGLFWIATSALADALNPDSRLRCIATLLRIAGRRRDNDTPATIPISHTELASLCNLSRQTSGDILRGLEAERLVELGYRRITLPEPARLRARLDS